MGSLRYVEVLSTEGKRCFLRVEHETAMFLTGIEVDRHGEEIVPGKGYHNRRHIMQKATIKNIVEMRMNNHYATLERVSK